MIVQAMTEILRKPLREAFVSGMDYTGKIETNKKGEPVALFRPNSFSMITASGPLTGLFTMLSGDVPLTESQLVARTFNHGNSSLTGIEQTQRALNDIRKYQSKAGLA